MKHSEGKLIRASLYTFLLSALILLLSALPSFAANKVFYYHTDAAGTPMAMTDEDGDVVWEADYMPFGEEYELNETVKNRQRFIGKEKDEETDLYYFGARYLDGRTGRFIKPDPVGITEADLLNPQKFNRYNYSLNNPYKYNDPDGEWPEEIHNRIIDETFSAGKYKLPDDVKSIFKEASAHVDTFQDPGDSYMHAMQSPYQSKELAERLMDTYIKRNIVEFKSLMAEGKTAKAYHALGEAMHPIMDSTSPAHEGTQTWDGLSHPIKAEIHRRKETAKVFKSNPKYLKRNIRLLRKLYDEAHM